MNTLDPNQLVSHRLTFGGVSLAVSNFVNDRLINNYLQHNGSWEPWQLSLMQRIIKPHFTCVDIGANIGINAMFMSRLCPQGRVVAFEPFDAIHAVLAANIAQNALANITPVNKGISDKSTTLHMITNPEMVGGAHVTEGRIDGSQHATGAFEFARLDDELRARGISKVDFMKVDVEGHELKALVGAVPFLTDPDLQLFIEFNPRELARPAPPQCMFPDRQLFDLLKSYFRHVFFMGRDNTLFEVKSFHELRRKLMGGYFVDDLYCTNRIRPEVADLVVTGPAASPRVRTATEMHGDMSITCYNRDADGCALGDRYNAAVVSLHVTGGGGRRLMLKFDRIYAKHLHSPAFTRWPVWVMAGDASVMLDLYDSERHLQIDPGQEPLDLTLQSAFHTPASVYLGNPRDPRSIGFRLQVVEM